MSHADTLKLYEKLRAGFQEKEAKVIAEAIDEALVANNETLLNEVATKRDVAAIEEKIDRSKLELKQEMAEFKAEMLKWMFLFWIGQAAVVIGIVKFIK